MPLATGLTLGRASDIESGVGEPPSADELAQFAAWKAQMAPVTAKIRPKLIEAGRAYEASGYARLPLRERLRLQNWTPQAYRLYRTRTARCWSAPRTRTTRRRHTSRTRRARSPSRSTDDPELDLAQFRHFRRCVRRRQRWRRILRIPQRRRRRDDARRDARDGGILGDCQGIGAFLWAHRRGVERGERAHNSGRETVVREDCREHRPALFVCKERGLSLRRRDGRHFPPH
jgi:hypothetical protein